MKFGQFMQYHKRKFFVKKMYGKCGLETSSRPFLIFKKSSVKGGEGQSAVWTIFESFANTYLI